jgi:hypothetical protein
VRIKISATPAAAILTLNGRQIGPGPYEGTFPRSAESAEVRAESPGFEPENRSVKLDSDGDVSIVLKPIAVESTSSASTRGGSRHSSSLGRQKTATSPAEPAPKAVEPTKPADAPELKTPPKSKAGVILDTDNPWKK